MIREQLPDDPPAKRKDVIEPAGHEQPVHERPERTEGQGVLDAIAHQRPLARLVERMGVPPDRVGTLDLHVDEPKGRLPELDQRPPANRYPRDAEAIIDDRALTHLYRAGRRDLEAERRWRQSLEVSRVGEERKHAR